MQSFKFTVPTVLYFGRNEFERSGKIAKGVGKKALVAIGKESVKRFGYLDRLTAMLDKSGVKYIIFEGVEPNPRSRTINTGGNMARKNDCDFIIALGGGSVMDAAKGMAVVARTGDDIWDYCGRSDFSPKKVGDALPLFCIPTLAATGSEIDAGAVISNDDVKLKSVVHGDRLIPKFAVVDPVLTMTAPVNYVIDGAVDIICHCIETYLSCKTATSVQDYFTMGLVRSVKTAIEDVLAYPDELVEGRDTLCWASSMAMAGVLNGRRGGWPIHEIEHTLSGLYDISHGRGLAILIPALMRFNIAHNRERVKSLIGFFLHENTGYYCNTDGINAICELENWMKSINALPENLDILCKAKVDPDEIARLTLDVYGDENGSLFNNVPLKYDDIKKIIRSL